jgi:hypothetical protein
MKLSRRNWFTKAGLLIPALCVTTKAQTVLLNSLRFGVPASCNTLRDSYETTTDNQSNAVDYMATRILTGGSSYTTCKVGVRVGRTVSDTTDYELQVRSDSADSPGTSLTTVTIPNASILTSVGWVEIDLTTPIALTSATNYWIVMKKIVSNSEALSWARGSTGNAEHIMSSANGSTWANLSTTRQGNFRTYSV